MIVLPDAFYTTAEQEAELQELYEKEVAIKQKELDIEYMRTKKIQKYKATMYISEKERVFYVCEKGVLWKNASGSPMPTEPQEGGKIYTLDTESDGSGLIEQYCKEYKEFFVKFYPICSGGIAYCAKENVYPAVLECPAHKLIVEDDRKYDLLCG